MTGATLPDLDELREMARRMLRDSDTVAKVRASIDDPAANAPVWDRLVAAGWTGIVVQEEFGGAGASFAELAAILVELGRALAPGPYLGSAVLATSVLLHSGDTDARRYWLPRLASGESVAAAAITGPSGRLGGDEPAPRLTKIGHGFRLDGVVRFVPDAAQADLILIAALLDDEPVVVLVRPDEHSGLAIELTPTVDLSRRLATVRADAVELPLSAVLARGDEASAAIGAARAWGAVALACDSLGVAEHVLASTVAYVGQREQFGRPIGSFQAVKHRCADIFIAVETSRVVVEDAARWIDGDYLEAAEVVALAKSFACDAAAKVAGDGVQLHGGVGFTWEHDSHLYLKRAKLNQALLGGSRWHRHRLADLVLPGHGSGRPSSARPD